MVTLYDSYNTKCIMENKPHDIPLPITFLIADDHDALRESLANWMHTLYPNIRILRAENGKQALQACEQYCPDFVLLDLKLPDIDGFALCQQLIELCPAAEVFIMSIHEGEAYQRQALLSGAKGLLSKNTMVNELPLILTQFMETKEY